MPLARLDMSSRRTWWGFVLLIVAPALALALLGLRSVRGERIEREQQLRDRQVQTARLVDAGISASLSEIERGLRLRDSAPQDSVSQVGDPDIHFFSFDHSGQLTFSGDRVYFGDSSRKDGTSNWAPSIEQLIEQARAAEAQQREGQAAALYKRITVIEPRLRAWAQLSLLHVEHKDDIQVLNQVSSDEADTEGPLTPGGLPIALVACARVETLSIEQRGRYTEIIERVLHQLRAGRWWLSFDERTFYDQELRSLLGLQVGDYSMPDGRLRELATIARLLGAVPRRRDEPTRHFERSEGGAMMILLSPSQKGSTFWQGAALNDQALTRLLDDVIDRAGVAQMGNTCVTDETGRSICGSALQNAAGMHSEPLLVVPGWALVFERKGAAGWLDEQTLLWLGFIGVLIVTMLSSLAGTVRVVRREGELARIQNDFIAGVSHEFKSPISSIRLLVERMAGGRITSEVAATEYQAATERELTRLERHVNRLLEAQQIQVGQRRYNFAAASLSDIAAQAIAELTTQAEAKQIRIERETDPELPRLQLDAAAMRDAIANLIGNAIKYSPAGSQIIVATRLYNRNGVVEICDEGPGIDRSDARKIFNRFYRGKGSYQQSVNGTGLGLALVKATAQAHGGNVSVTSTPGKGSRFTISLPLERRLD